MEQALSSDYRSLHHQTARALGRFRRQIPGAVLDELCQDAALRVFTARSVRCPTAFAHRVAVRLAIDWLRAAKRAAAWSERVDDGEDGWSRAEVSLDTSRVLGALREAPPGYRELILRHFVDDLDLGDLARAELARRGESGDAAFARARDSLYKRRNRVLAWLRERLAEPTRRTT